MRTLNTLLEEKTLHTEKCDKFLKILNLRLAGRDTLVTLPERPTESMIRTARNIISDGKFIRFP